MKSATSGSLRVLGGCMHPCGSCHLAQIATGQRSAQRFVAAADMHDDAFAPGQQSVVYAREDKIKEQICIECVGIEKGAITKIACEPTIEVIREAFDSRGVEFTVTAIAPAP